MVISKHLLFIGLILVGTVHANEALHGVKTTREGVLYRIDEAARTPSRTAYRILEREADADTAAALEATPARLHLTERMQVKDVAAILLKDHGMAVRFSGQGAVVKSGRMVGPVVVSGSLLGALRNLGNQAGLQTIVHRDAIEFADRKGFALALPSFENQTEIATKLMGTGASNIKMAAGAVNFEADSDALRAVQHLVRELRQGRRGVSPFLSDLASRQPAPPTPPPAAPDARSTELSVAEQALMKQMGIDAKSIKTSPPVLPVKTKAASPDPLLASTITITYEGDLVKAVERLAEEAEVAHRIVSKPRKPVKVKLNFRNAPLQAVLEALGRQSKGKAEIVYDKSARRIDIVAR
ncbi:MAG: DotD/TraH family lipoprotein [Rhodocyclaceae bacterium]|nr:DotD/TraH family lipoprotein [Rhodocyclaceae bacterium]